MRSIVAAAKPRRVTALVTGANSGIGFAVATQLARAGVTVFLGCRSAERGADAVRRLKAAVPGGDVQLLRVDVAWPASVIAAAAALRECILGAWDGHAFASPAEPHLDFLFLNAGILPLAGYRWSVVADALRRFSLPFFLTTGRAHAAGAHFLVQPDDDLGAAGAPSVFATHVLGHLLLLEELLHMLRPQPASKIAAGRAIWTGSRSATQAKLDWAHLEPPSAKSGDVSGHAAWLARRAASPPAAPHGEFYGEAKYATDLLNVSCARRFVDNCALLMLVAVVRGAGVGSRLDIV